MAEEAGVEGHKEGHLSFMASYGSMEKAAFSLYSGAVTAFKWSNNGQLRRESFVALYLEI